MLYCLFFRFLLLVFLSLEEYFSCCVPPPDHQRATNYSQKFCGD